MEELIDLKNNKKDSDKTNQVVLDLNQFSNALVSE